MQIALHVIPSVPILKPAQDFASAALPYPLEQRWTLFAPHLSDVNLRLVIGLRRESDLTEQFVDVSSWMHQRSVDRRFWSSRVERIGTNFNQTAVQYTQLRSAAERAEQINSEPLPRSVVDELDRRSKTVDVLSHRLATWLASQSDLADANLAKIIITAHPTDSGVTSRAYESDWIRIKNQ